MNNIFFDLSAALTPVSITGTSAQSSALGDSTADGVGDSRVDVLIVGDVDMHITSGANPTATTNNFLLPAFTIMPAAVQNGDKIAGIQSSANGNMYIVPVK